MLSDPLLILAAVTLLGVIVVFIDLAIGNLSIPALDLEDPAHAPFPRVSIITAARNEERDIREALQSILHLDYPNYEVIAVNDRSEDETGQILDNMRTENPQLVVIHVETLPEGWLGKNHALHTGASASSGELILFSDADVKFARTALSRAVGYMQRNGIDHVTVAPRLEHGSIPLSLAVQFFFMAFTMYMRPWKARDPKSRHFMGIGAFNLMRRAAYEKAGTMARIPLRPDDDIMLAKILKQSGARQHIVNGQEMLSVHWYYTLREMVAGLQKNAFAALKYSLILAIGAVTANVVFNIWPFAAIFLTSGLTRTLNIAVCLLLMTMYAGGAFRMRGRAWLAIAYPAAAAIFIYILVTATARTMFRRGIAWRGTRYSLDDLKANKV
jgi:glycosyltransferase involved in cell wall biosynthesis